MPTTATANCQLMVHRRTANCQLPAANCPLPTARWQVHAADEAALREARAVSPPWARKDPRLLVAPMKVLQ
jgi:hypothetical protein